MSIWKQKYLELRRKVAHLTQENAALEAALAMYRVLYPTRQSRDTIRYIEIDGYTFVETSFVCPEEYEVLDDMANMVASVSLRYGTLEAKYFDKEGTYETIYTYKFYENTYKASFDNTEERMQFLAEIAKLIAIKAKDEYK